MDLSPIMQLSVDSSRADLLYDMFLSLSMISISPRRYAVYLPNQNAAGATEESAYKRQVSLAPHNRTTHSGEHFTEAIARILQTRRRGEGKARHASTQAASPLPPLQSQLPQFPSPQER
jgi:hypothetical protein